MKTLLLRLVLATMCMVAAASAHAQQGDWGNFVFVSSALGNNANKLCLGEGLRGSDIGCPTYAPYVSNSGAVGISTSTPQTKLDVNGEVRVSNSAIACAANTTGGAIRYVSGTGLQLCGGNNTWTTLGSGSAGVSAISSLTDVSLTNLAGRDYLRFDQPSGKWVNISESTVMSTTTMLPNFPDAIRCTAASGITLTMYLSFSPNEANVYYTEPFSSSSADFSIWYNATTGAYVSQVTRDYANCKVSIGALDAAGQAFNFIGGGASSNALGDRITSGTSAVTVNSATSYISLTTGRVDWGYLNSGLSYLPRLNAANVSASYVSSTLTQVSGTSLACTTALKGSIRYSNTSNTLEYCNSTAWVSAGPSSTQPVSFRVTKGGTNQTSVATNATITWPTEVFDTNNNFASNRFTVTVPGKYLFQAQIRCTSNTTCLGQIVKGGGSNALVRSGSFGTANSYYGFPSCVRGEVGVQLLRRIEIGNGGRLRICKGRAAVNGNEFASGDGSGGASRNSETLGLRGKGGQGRGRICA